MLKQREILGVGLECLGNKDGIYIEFVEPSGFIDCSEFIEDMIILYPPYIQPANYGDNEP
jgi:hypothetical protein